MRTVSTLLAPSTARTAEASERRQRQKIEAPGRTQGPLCSARRSIASSSATCVGSVSEDTIPAGGRYARKGPASTTLAASGRACRGNPNGTDHQLHRPSCQAPPISDCLRIKGITCVPVPVPHKTRRFTGESPSVHDDPEEVAQILPATFWRAALQSCSHITETCSPGGLVIADPTPGSRIIQLERARHPFSCRGQEWASRSGSVTVPSSRRGPWRRRVISGERCGCRPATCASALITSSGRTAGVRWRSRNAR